MGVLNLECLTTDGTALYGFTITKDYSDGSEYAVLVKSAPNPTDVNSVEWTLVSAIQRPALLDLGTSTGSEGPTREDDFMCAVDKKGVFTLMAAQAGDVGIQFDPAGDSSAENPWRRQGSPGLWSNIRPSPGLWAGARRAARGRALIPLEGSAPGASEWVVAFVDVTQGGVLFGRVNGSNKSLADAGRWALPAATFGKVTHLRFNKGRLFVVGSTYNNATALSSYVIHSIPLSSATISGALPTTGLQAFGTLNDKGHQESQSWEQSGFVGDKLFLASHGTPFKRALATLDTATTGAALSPFTDYINDHFRRGFVPVARADGTPSLAFAIDSTLLMGLDIGPGPLSWKWEYSKGHVAIPGTLGADPSTVYPRPSPGPTTHSSSGDENIPDLNGKDLLLGIFVPLAAIVLGCILICCCMRKRERRLREEGLRLQRSSEGNGAGGGGGVKGVGCFPFQPLDEVKGDAYLELVDQPSLPPVYSPRLPPKAKCRS